MTMRQRTNQAWPRPAGGSKKTARWEQNGEGTVHAPFIGTVLGLPAMTDKWDDRWYVG